jgi:hypothetical protein
VQARSIARDDFTPTACAYTSNVIIIAGSEVPRTSRTRDPIGF